MINPTSEYAVPQSSNNLFDRVSRSVLNAKLSGITSGQLTINDSGASQVYGSVNGAADVIAVVHVHDSRFYSDVVLGGSIGAAETYIRGYWTTDDLTAVIRIFVANRTALEQLDSGWATLVTPLRRLLHWMNRNTRNGSRKNISAHYDLGNEFFALWLDERMMYSSAIFERTGMSLEDAATAKLERICQKLDLQAGDRVVEIGTGWGGFAIYAAQQYGCHVITTTISREQHDLARERVTSAGLDDRVTVLEKDYRDLEGEYDKLVSIEMIEAVGHENLGEFFDKCSSLLKEDGVMCLQSITIADQRFEQASKSVDFIQKYIFPGGCLPSLTALSGAICNFSDMQIRHVEDFGQHYALTLNEWRSRFGAQLAEIRGQGYSDEFLRLWDYYFCYCEGAFTERAIGVSQLLISRPGDQREALLGDLRQI